MEFSAVNITGFRIVHPDRPMVEDFLKKWVNLDPIQFEGAGKNWITVRLLILNARM